MKRERIDLGGGTLIEAAMDQNGRYFIALNKNSSRLFNDPVEMRKWIGLPIKTPSRERYDAWIESLGVVKQDDASVEEDPTKNTKMVI